MVGFELAPCVIGVEIVGRIICANEAEAGCVAALQRLDGCLVFAIHGVLIAPVIAANMHKAVAVYRTDQRIAVINVVAIAAEQAASVIEYFKTPYITSRSFFAVPVPLK